MNPLEGKKKNTKEFVIALYSRPNESFPSKLDVMVNGHVGVLVEGQPCVLPRFLVEQAKLSKQFTHRENSDPNNETYETIAVKPTIEVTLIDEEYQSPEGITALLKDASQIKDVESPYYRLRLGCKNLVYGDMMASEKIASAEVANSPKAIDERILKLQSELYEKNEALGKSNDRLDRLEAMIEKMAGGSEPKVEAKPEPVDDEAERTFNGKVYKTVAAASAARTKAEKLKAKEVDFPETNASEDEEPIEIEV